MIILNSVMLTDRPTDRRRPVKRELEVVNKLSNSQLDDTETNNAKLILI